eukprot:g15799.t1
MFGVFVDLAQALRWRSAKASYWSPVKLKTKPLALIAKVILKVPLRNTKRVKAFCNEPLLIQLYQLMGTVPNWSSIGARSWTAFNT